MFWFKLKKTIPTVDDQIRELLKEEHPGYKIDSYHIAFSEKCPDGKTLYGISNIFLIDEKKIVNGKPDVQVLCDASVFSGRQYYMMKL